MSGFEFIFGLFSVILSLSITEVLSASARLIRSAERVRFSLTQALWMALFLLTAIGNWISLWQVRDVPTWGALQLFSAIALVSVQFVACALVCPDVPDAGEIDMAAFHAQERRRYLWAYVALFAVSVIGNLFFVQTERVERWAQENAMIPPWAAGVLLALFARNVWLQRLGLAVALGMTLYFLATSRVS